MEFGDSDAARHGNIGRRGIWFSAALRHAIANSAREGSASLAVVWQAAGDHREQSPDVIGSHAAFPIPPRSPVLDADP